MTSGRSFLGFPVLGLVLSYSAVAVAQPDWIYREPGLEQFSNYQWRPVRWQDHEKEFEALIEGCVRQFRMPFELPEGTRIVPGEDDKELTRERTCSSGCFLIGCRNGETAPPDTTLAHGALDIGSRITRDNGKTLEKLGNAPIRAVHPGGFIRQGILLEQKIFCQRGPYRLIVLIKYGHIKPAPQIGPHWQPTPNGTIGRLEGRNTWRSLDASLSQTMPDKGNHIHLIVEGIYDLNCDATIAHSEQMKGNPIAEEHDELLQKRARFFNEQLLPRVTGQEKSGPVATAEKSGKRSNGVVRQLAETR